MKHPFCHELASPPAIGRHLADREFHIYGCHHELGARSDDGVSLPPDALDEELSRHVGGGGHRAKALAKALKQRDSPEG